MSETWKRVRASRVRGIPAGYEASNLGRVRSVDRILANGRSYGGVVLKPWLDKDGYQQVRFGPKNVRVHVAVQLAWAGEPEVRHLNGDPLDCRPSNLRWGSRVENEQDKRKTERKKAGSEGASLRSNLGHLGRGGLG